MTFRVLVVDDEEAIRSGLAASLKADNLVVETTATLAEGLQRARLTTPDVILLDRCLPDGEGVERIQEFRSASEGGAVIIVTGYGDCETIVRAIKAGASNFLLKPLDPDDLLRTIDAVAEDSRMRREAQRRLAVARSGAAGMILGDTESIRHFRLELARVAPTSATVLFLGESGVGKGLAAETLHALSCRADGPFVELNCAGLPASLLESELFGHEKGAFTDAHERKAGLLEVADRGTLFLDEIAELELGVQAKLLKVLDQRRFRRLGGRIEIPSDFRLVAATNRNLAEEVHAGRFRDDLYYRLKVVVLAIPPLRERRADIPLLAQATFDRLRCEIGSPVSGFSDLALDALVAYDWPGNIRELRNAIERSLILTRSSRIDPSELPPEIGGIAGRAPRPSAAVPVPAGGPEAEEVWMIDALVDRHVARAFRVTHGNVARTAKLLGLSRSALYDRLRRLGLLGPR